jgi:hypothetical protein
MYHFYHRLLAKRKSHLSSQAHLGFGEFKPECEADESAFHSIACFVSNVAHTLTCSPLICGIFESGSDVVQGLCGEYGRTNLTGKGLASELLAIDFTADYGLELEDVQ